MSIKSELEKTAQYLRSARKAVIGRGGEISPTAGLDALPDAIFNIPADIALAYQTDDAVAYEKTVPSNAEEYARVGKLGGMSRRSINWLEPVDWETQTVNGYTLTRLPDGSVEVTGAALEAKETIFDFAVNDKNGTKKYAYLDRYKTYVKQDFLNGQPVNLLGYRVEYLDEKGGVSWTGGLETSNRPRAITKVYKQFTPKVGDTTYNGIWSTMVVEQGQSTDTYIPYHKGLRDAEVEKIECRDVDGNVIDTIAVPEAVKAIEGYGKGVNSEYYNYLLWTADENGKPRVQFVQNTYRAVVTGGERLFITYTPDSAPFAEYLVGRAYISVTGPDDISTVNLISNHYIPSARHQVANKTIVGLISFTAGVRFTGVYMTEAEMQAKLRAWYESGDPLTCELILAEPIITDITDLIDTNMFVKVAGGGKVIFDNEHKEAVPSEITYLIETVGE